MKRLLSWVKHNRTGDLILLGILAFLGHRGWYRPGLLTWGDAGMLYREGLLNFLSPPFIWSSATGLGAYDILFLPFQPLFSLMALICQIFKTDFSIASRVVFYIPLTFLPTFSMYYLCYRLFKKRIISFFAAFFYSFNTYILLIQSGGHVHTAMCYALLPLILGLFIKSQEEKKIRDGIICGALIALSMAYEMRGAYLTLLALFFYYMFSIFPLLLKRRVKELLQTIPVPLTMGLLVILLHFYWVFPSFAFQAPTAPAGYTAPFAPMGLSYYRWYHALTLYLTNWICWLTGTPWTRVKPLFWLLPILAYYGFRTGGKNRNVRFFFLLAIIALFLTKGSNPPLGKVNLWIFRYIPGMQGFRDPSKFYALIALAYAPLIGFGISSFLEKVKKFTFLANRKIKPHGIKALFLLLAVFFFIQLVSPTFTRGLGLTFEPHPVPKEYVALQKFIEEKPPNFRTYWFPYKTVYSFYCREYPIVDNGFPSDFIRYFFSWIWNPEVYNQTKYMSKMLGLLNVKYLILPPDKGAEAMANLYKIFNIPKNEFLSQISQQKGLKKIEAERDVTIFENMNYLPRFFATSNGALVVGSRKSLLSLVLLERFDFSDWALFFSDQLKEKALEILPRLKTVILYERDLDALLLASVDGKYRYDLYELAVWHVIGPPGTWKKVHHPPHGPFGPRQGEMAHSERGVVTATGYAKIRLPFSIKEKGDYDFWMRVGREPEAGEISVIHSHALARTQVYDEDFESRWFRRRTHLIRGFHCIYYDKNLRYILRTEKGEEGISELVYKVENSQPIHTLCMKWDTLGLQPSRVGRFFVSGDGKEWFQVGETLTSDRHPYILRTSDYIRGKKKCYLKYQIEDENKEGGVCILNVHYSYTTFPKDSPAFESRDDEGMLSFREDLRYPTPGFYWKKLGSLPLVPGRQSLEIVNLTGKNYIDQIVIIPHHEMLALRRQFQDQMREKDILIIKEIENEFIAKEGKWSVSKEWDGEAGDMKVLRIEGEGLLSIPLNVPIEGDYRLALRLTTASLDNNLSIQVGDRDIYSGRMPGGALHRFFYLETEKIRLKEGRIEVTLKKSGKRVLDLDQIILFKGPRLSRFFSVPEEEPVSWKTINPTKYEVDFKLKRPGFLVFSESYHPGWRMNINQASPIIGYSLLNIFPIDRTGEIKAVVEFTPQRYVYQGLRVSLSALFLLFVYFLYLGLSSILIGKKMKERSHLKFSILVIILGLLFASLYLANSRQLPRIQEKSVRIELGDEGVKKYLLSGWSEERPPLLAKEREALLKISLPKKETYRLIIKAFSCSPPDVRDQRMEVHFNSIALKRLKFRKSPHWQEFRMTIPSSFIFEGNIIKFIFSQNPSYIPITFDSLVFTNYIARLHKGITLYFLHDPPTLELQREEPNLFIQLFFYPPPPRMMPRLKAFGFSLVFIIFFWTIWRLPSRFLYLRTNLRLSQTMKLDLLTYLPSLILLLLFALISFFSRYQIVYTVGTFFILLIVPTFALKTWFIYRDIIIKPRTLGVMIQGFVYKIAILLGKGIVSPIKLIRQGLKASRISLIQYHKKNLSSALILDFMLLLLLCMLSLIIGIPPLADFLAYPAYFLLLTGVIMKTVAFFREKRP